MEPVRGALIGSREKAKLLPLVDQLRNPTRFRRVHEPSRRHFDSRQERYVGQEFP